MLVDAHAHLDDEDYGGGVDGVIDRAWVAGVKRIIGAGYDLASSRRMILLARRRGTIRACAGVHPHDARKAGERVEEDLEKLARESEVVAIGETGLDFYRDLSPRPAQVELFRKHIRVARKLGLPLVVHDRNAHAEVLRIMREEKASDVGGVVHCFSGDWEMARHCIAMGFCISFAGPVTFANASRLQDLARRVPADALLLETDSPYLAPEPVRGRRNEPANLRYVVRRVADLRGMGVDELACVTARNARRIFGITVEEGG